MLLTIHYLERLSCERVLCGRIAGAVRRVSGKKHFPRVTCKRCIAYARKHVPHLTKRR